MHRIRFTNWENEQFYGIAVCDLHDIITISCWILDWYRWKRESRKWWFGSKWGFRQLILLLLTVCLMFLEEFLQQLWAVQIALGLKCILSIKNKMKKGQSKMRYLQIWYSDPNELVWAATLACVQPLTTMNHSLSTWFQKCVHLCQ